MHHRQCRFASRRALCSGRTDACRRFRSRLSQVNSRINTFHFASTPISRQLGRLRALLIVLPLLRSSSRLPCRRCFPLLFHSFPPRLFRLTRRFRLFSGSSLFSTIRLFSSRTSLASFQPIKARIFRLLLLSLLLLTTPKSSSESPSKSP